MQQESVVVESDESVGVLKLWALDQSGSRIANNGSDVKECCLSVTM